MVRFCLGPRPNGGGNDFRERRAIRGLPGNDSSRVIEGVCTGESRGLTPRNPSSRPLKVEFSLFPGLVCHITSQAYAQIRMARNHCFCMNYRLTRCGTVQKDIAVPRAPTKFPISGAGGLVRVEFTFIPI